MQANDPALQPVGDLLYPALRHYWHPVAYGDDVREQPLGVTLLDQPIVLFRHEGRAIALADRCVHRSARLSLGRVVAEGIECAYHGWRYQPDGRCVHLPSSPDALAALQARIKAFRVTEAAGLIWVALEEPRAPVPAFPEYGNAAYRVLRGPSYEWRTSAARRLENFCDFAHFSFIHDGTLGARSKPEVKQVELWREGQVLRIRRSGLLEPNASKKKELLGIAEAWIAPTNEYHVTLPHTVHLERIFPNGKRYALLMAASPVSADRTRSFWWQARDFGTEPEHDAFFLDFEAKILAEDIAIVESQQPPWIPLGAPGSEASVLPADQVSMAYRRALMEIVAEHRRAARTGPGAMRDAIGAAPAPGEPDHPGQN